MNLIWLPQNNSAGGHIEYKICKIFGQFRPSMRTIFLASETDFSHFWLKNDALCTVHALMIKHSFNEYLFLKIKMQFLEIVCAEFFKSLFLCWDLRSYKWGIMMALILIYDFATWDNKSIYKIAICNPST